MKVLYFSDNASDHNRRFLEKLAAAGMQVWFLDPTTDGPAENWLPEGVRWVRTTQRLQRGAEPAAFAEFLPELQDRLQEIQPDLIHAGPTHSSGYVTALSNFHPWLLTSWGSDVLYHADRGPKWKQATQQALRGADGFFCDCYAVRARAKEMADLPDDRIVQFPWGIRIGTFSPDGDRPGTAEFTPEPGTRVLISTRSWEPLYGINVLLEAFRRAYRLNPSLRLLMMGKGSEAGWVQGFIATHGLAQVIRTPGVVSGQEMAKWFRVADAYVSCTHADGTSVSLLEAMSTGLPVVVVDLPSNREWVVEGQNGWLAPPGAVKEFADRMSRAARLNPEERALFAARNRGIVEQRADWDRNFPRLLKMYAQLVAMEVRL